MNNKTINKVRVIVGFPGYKVGDVLELDPGTGLFHFIGVTKEDGVKGDAFDVFAAELVDEIRSSITKKEILFYMDDIFEDISTYKVRSFRELERRIDEIKALTERLEEDASLFPEDEFNQKEALTVWQNMLWEYEWIMGMRELYFNNCDANPEKALLTDNDQISNLVKDDSFIDGNALEEESNKENEKSDIINQVGESY